MSLYKLFVLPASFGAYCGILNGIIESRKSRETNFPQVFSRIGKSSINAALLCGAWPVTLASYGVVKYE